MKIKQKLEIIVDLLKKSKYNIIDIIFYFIFTNFNISTAVEV